MTDRAINVIWRIAVGALALYWIVIFTGTHTPAPPEMTFQIHDKTLHFNGFWLLGFLLILVMTLRRGWTAGRTAIALAIIAAYGAADEWTQPWVGRDCDFYDWVADIFGAAVGVLLGMGAVSLLARRLKASGAAREQAAPKPEEPAGTA